MKRILLTLFITISASIFSQAPEMMSYQAIIRNAQNELIQNENIGIQISVLQGSVTGTAVYTETHTTTTNENGLITLNIGAGTTSDDFSAIDWGNGNYFVKTDTDPNGGTNYTISGTSQLLSVPYALYAKSSGATKWNDDANGIKYNDGDVTIDQPGSSIVLTSPNGTKYEVTVNDSGELSLPTSNASSNSPNNLYIYGSFNGWDAGSSLKLLRDAQHHNNYSEPEFVGIKYFEAGTEFKFLQARNEDVIYGGFSSSTGDLIENSDAIEILSSGIYKIYVTPESSSGTSYSYKYTISQVGVNFAFTQDMSYDATNDEFTLEFTESCCYDLEFYIASKNFGDNLQDGSINYYGDEIVIPSDHNTTLIKLKLNFNFTGDYTLTKID